MRRSSDVQVAVLSMKTVGYYVEVLVVFRLEEVGIHLRPLPALRPRFEVVRVAPSVEHHVEHARSAEHLASGPKRAPTYETETGALLGLGMVGPIELGLLQHLVGDRDITD